MKKLSVFLCLFLGLKTLCFSQEKLFKAALPKAPENGFYKIPLQPEILSFSNAGFSDIRLFDDNNREVPYLLERTEFEKMHQYFREYPVLSKNSIPKATTTLILKNPNSKKISNISLVIKNTNVTKKANLSGSSDAQKWYALEDDYVLQSVTNTEETSDVKVLQFPLSDYEFYKLEINDSVSAPLNILKAGYYDFNAEKGNLNIIPNLQFSRRDSSAIKKTILKFTSERPVLIDKLEFMISSPTFYLRNATVFEKQTVTGRRGKKRVTLIPVQNFQLKSDSKNSIQFDNFRAQEFYIEIENADNPPLQFERIEAFQLHQYLIAELQKGKNYELRFGKENALQPTYDLQYFKDKIPENLPVLTPGRITIIKRTEKKPEGLNAFFRNKNLIWVALVAVVALLGFMTRQMLQEAGKTKLP